MLKAFTKYDKFLVALLGAVVTVALHFYGTSQYVQMAVLFLTTLGVYVQPNKA